MTGEAIKLVEGKAVNMPLDFDGKRYEQASTHQKEWGSRLIESLELAGDERVLDLGCGDGALTAQMAKCVPRGQVIGVDASPGMLNVARQYQAENLQFQLLDIENLSYDSEFDLVFSNATLHFLRDHSNLLRNIYRALRNGGVVRCNFGADGNCVHFFQAVRETMDSDRFASYFDGVEWPYYMPEVDEYRNLVSESHFRQFEVWGENADRYFPDATALTKWIDQPAIVAFLKSIAGSDKQVFRDSVVKKTIALTQQPDGTCFETFRRVNLLAKKSNQS